MRISEFRHRYVASMRSATLALVSCAIAACAGHAPTRPAVVHHAASAPAVRKHGGWSTETSAAEAKRDLAKSDRDSLSASEAGYYLDVLQGRLLQVLGTDAKLSRTADRIGIDLSDRVRLDANSPWLDAAGCRLLQPLARALAEFRKTVISVKVGAYGSDRKAEMLAERRSDAVAECLARSGIMPRRIVVRTLLSDPAANASGGALKLDVELVLRNAGNEP